eukprot:m.34071 g.34071  ORF g.34071 m.34071 type:complete len:179 (+) comp10972_c1_seq1:136-672(+)
MDGLLGSISPAEIEFLAEDTAVTITPFFEAGVFLFLQEKIGPFRPQRPMEVPLWLAASLRRRGKCLIHVPEWLTVDSLATKLEEEKTLRSSFAPMPEHYLEVSSILFDVASQDILESEKCRQLIQDITDARMTKIRQGLDDIKTSVAVKLNNVTRMEITSVRQFFSQAMDAFNKLTSI